MTSSPSCAIMIANSTSIIEERTYQTPYDSVAKPFQLHREHEFMRKADRAASRTHRPYCPNRWKSPPASTQPAPAAGRAPARIRLSFSAALPDNVHPLIGK